MAFQLSTLLMPLFSSSVLVSTFSPMQVIFPCKWLEMPQGSICPQGSIAIWEELVVERNTSDIDPGTLRHLGGSNATEYTDFN